ncbi:MAG: molybdenum cofactor biosynthesis protein MoaE [Desulfurococcaceae archaeon]
MKDKNTRINYFKNNSLEDDETYLGKSINANRIHTATSGKNHISTSAEHIAMRESTKLSHEEVLDQDNELSLTTSISSRSRYIDVKILESNEKIDLNTLVDKLTRIDEKTGALVLFIGFVKGLVENQSVNELEYTAVTNVALSQMEKIAVEESERYDLSAVIIWHYIGTRKKGEVSLIIATVGKDRKSALEGASIILKRVKNEVPIFKLEKRSDGEYWVVGDGVRYPRPVQKKN